jgi:FkbM family methyltransferase
MLEMAQLKSINRALRPLATRLLGDPQRLYPIAYPLARGLSWLPGTRGIYWDQVAIFLNKSVLSREAARQFAVTMSTLGPGDIAIDLGANVGEFTELMANTGCTVHSFEPDPWAIGRLEERIAARDNVVLHRCAAGTESGTITLLRSPFHAANPGVHSQGSTMMQRSDFDPRNGVEVEVIDFLAFLEELDRPVKVIKMDIEGAEVALLEALFESPLLQRIEAIFVETHYNLFPEQLFRVAELRRRAEDLRRPKINFDWH